MRYIKLFENLDKLYREVDSEEAFFSNPHIAFTMKEVISLSKLGFYTLYGIEETPTHYVLNKRHRDDSYNYTLYIYRLEDDYFLLRATGEGSHRGVDIKYKCDQWDGLLDCLKKEFDIE